MSDCGEFTKGDVPPAFPGVELRRIGGDDVAAEIAVSVRPEAGAASVREPTGPTGQRAREFTARLEVAECGVDGVRASTPLVERAGALGEAGGDFSLSIPTPFRWSDADRPMYALLVWLDPRDGAPAGFEVIFGFGPDDSLHIVQRRGIERGGGPGTVRSWPAVFVVGDSTAFSFGRNQLGWGDALSAMVRPAVAHVCNRARPGRSTRSFRREGLWARTCAELRRGDVVLIQFGHNDADTLDRGRCRGVVPGTGDEETTVRLPDGREEVVHAFGWYLRQYVEETRAAGARPVLLSPTPRNAWCDEKLDRNPLPHGGWAAEVARSSGADFVDVTARVSERLEALGRPGVEPLFCSASDPVHSSPSGAKVIARCIAVALVETGLLPSDVLETNPP